MICPEDNPIKVSVVVTTYNRRDSLTRCLASLAAQTFPPGDYEIVVVDDGCTDGTPDLLRSFTAPCAFLWISQPNQGQPAAQNAGVAAARGDIVIFMDDDCICDPGLVAAHHEAQSQSTHRVAIGAVLLHPESPPGTLRDNMKKLADLEFQRACSQAARRSDLMLCANSSIARHAALQCVFDTSYHRIHDVEAGVRLWAAGYRPHFAPKAVAYELYIKKPAAFLRDSFNQGKYEVILTARHPAFKPLATIVRINEGDPLKRALRRQLAVHSSVSEFVLRSVYSVANFLRGLPGFSWLARRVLKARAGVQHLKGAMQEAGSWKKLDEFFGRRVPVLMYHNVGTPHPGEYPGLTTPPQEFEAQLRFLTNLGYQAIRPSEWLQWRDEGGKLPERAFMLTFDDAYADASRNAFPVLRRYGFGATCMVVTRCIGTTNRWDENTGLPSFQLMTQSEILEWSRNGIEFGGHTASHPELPLVSDAEAEEEIAECKATLTALLGAPPACFAYPFGASGPAAQAAAGRHFELAFTTAPGMLHLATDPRLAPRIEFMPGETRFGIWCRLRYGRNPFEVFRNRLTKLLRKPRHGPPPAG